MNVFLIQNLFMLLYTACLHVSRMILYQNEFLSTSSESQMEQRTSFFLNLQMLLQY